jgi:hypothetical protein
MKLWQSQARPLPVRVRPIGGETVPSYARRLAEANDLFPTAILRAIGEHRYGTGYHLFTRDACLNDHAIDRLATYADISLDRLHKALPALSMGMPFHRSHRLPADRPAVYYYVPFPRPRPACRFCLLRRASGPTPGTALVRAPDDPLLCRRHRRWLGTFSETTQYDLSRASDIIAADHRYKRLLADDPDPGRVTKILHEAWHTTRDWAEHPAGQLPATIKRWHVRAEALGIPRAIRRPVVSFPEAVALTEILTDLSWRRHVAMVNNWELDSFYRRVAHHLGDTPQPSARSDYRLLWGHRDALTRWVDAHRRRFATIRRNHQAEQQKQWFPKPFPETRHFR